jgi:hypothetical protein
MQSRWLAPIEWDRHDRQSPAQRRVGLLVVIAVATALWLASFIPVYQIWTDPRADGFRAAPAFYATIVYAVLVLPALFRTVVGGERGLVIATRRLRILGIVTAAAIGLFLLGTILQRLSD